MNDFVALLGHELRSPLNNIAIWVEILKTTPPNSGRFHQAIAALEHAIAVQKNLLDDVSSLWRLMKGEGSLDLRWIDAAGLVGTTATAFQPEAQRRRIQLVMETLDGSVRLHADSGRLEQALRNLVSNALKFTPAGGQVRLAVECNDSEVVLVVSDTGCGISAEKKQHLFDRFYKGDTRPMEGLGLGLYLVRLVAEAHGGAAEAESEGPDRGATFRIRLPRPAHQSAETTVEARQLGIRDP